MAGGMMDSSNKTARELFVGNTPPGTQEMVLMEFLNAALQQVNMTTAPGNAIIQCRVSNKFAFIECRSIEETSNCLNLNGIPFMGNMLKIGRPTKYQGPHMTGQQTWQQLTGQGALNGPMADPNTKVYRELFIGNTVEGMNEVDLQEFLGAAMLKVGLTTQDGNPIVTTRLSGKFAFVELRTIEETNNMLNLNGIPYMGQNLRIGRPVKYNGPVVPHLDWNELLAKFVNGELQGKGGAGTPGGPAAGGAPSTRVIRLENMVTAEELQNDEEYNDIVEDTKEECAKFGQVVSIAVPRNGEPGTGFLFVEFADTTCTEKASAALHGRTFDGRRVVVTFFDEEKFKARDFVV